MPRLSSRLREGRGDLSAYLGQGVPDAGRYHKPLRVYRPNRFLMSVVTRVSGSQSDESIGRVIQVNLPAGKFKARCLARSTAKLAGAVTQLRMACVVGSLGASYVAVGRHEPSRRHRPHVLEQWLSAGIRDHRCTDGKQGQQAKTASLCRQGLAIGGEYRASSTPVRQTAPQGWQRGPV